jgi:hypothetical protein
MRILNHVETQYFVPPGRKSGCPAMNLSSETQNVASLQNININHFKKGIP